MVREVIDEALIARIWERQAFDSSALTALGLRVVYRGTPSDAGGPDYQDVILAREDGSLITGDVEFHVHASSWHGHGHDTTPRYDGVILHVVWKADCGPTVRSDGTVIPTLVLAGGVASPGATSLNRSTASPPGLALHPCISVFASLSTDAVAESIDALGWMRFRTRTDLLAAELESEASDQVAYRALLEGLGHASNRQAFRALADAVPYGWLMGVDPADRGAALLAGAGLGSSAAVLPPARLGANAWRLSRLRPGNHPARRILAVTALLERFRPTLVSGLVDGIGTCTRAIQVRTLLMSRAPGDAAIGAGRADELAASAILPLVAALEPELTVPRTLYELYPSPPSTRWTRAMLDLLQQAGHTVAVKRALQHQGLHLLYTQYCRREGPRDCPVCGRKRDLS